MANTSRYFHQLYVVKSIILLLAASLELSLGQVSTSVGVSAGPVDLSVGLGRGLRVGFYPGSCPNAESIVANAVRSRFARDHTIAPALLKLHYVDCFVRGCDASILLNGTDTERNAGPNLNLRGYEVIDEIKQELERQCPGVVSCADILALAARDAVVMTGGPSWDVPTGSRDGRVSFATEALNLPAPSDSMPDLISKFAAKGLTVGDLVTLVGGHTIGTAHCSSFQYRLYNYNSSRSGPTPDPSIDPRFLSSLQAACPANSNRNSEVALDTGSGNQFDNSFFRNMLQNRGVLESDQRLYTYDTSTSFIVERYVGRRKPRLSFRDEFGKSMVKMGNIEVLMGSKGEIRKLCSAINNP